jgi:diacylglycerol kinase family enzyme
VGSKRVWACLALAAAAVALGSLVVLVFVDTVALLIAVAALALAAAGAWRALGETNARRTVAVGATLLALAGGAIAFARRDAVAELAVLVAATIAFLALSRRALRSSPAADADAPRPVTGRHGSTRAVLLMNPKSGGGKVERFNLVAEARARGIEPIVLGPDDDLRELATAAAETGLDAIGVAGGDGSQAIVAQVALQQSIPFVCVPAGTRNHLALDLGLAREDVVGALDAFASESTHAVDLAFVDDRVFVNNVSLGLYADVVQSSAYRDAKLRTAFDELPELLAPGSNEFTFAGPDGSERHTNRLLLVSNNPYTLFGLTAGTRPRLDSGLLGIAEVEIQGAWDAAKLVTAGSGLRQWTASTFEVTAPSPIASAIDGEATTLDPPLTFRIAPAALQVLLPPDVDRSRSVLSQRPAAVLGELGSIAFGHAPATRSSCAQDDAVKPGRR